MRSLNILLVEDAVVLRQIQVPLFTKFGHQIEAASSCVEAMDMLKHKRYDLILMDLVMPNMDGFECTQAIQAMSVHTPIVAISGNNDVETQAQCLASGMKAFLNKPTPKDEFESLLRQLNLA